MTLVSISGQVSPAARGGTQVVVIVVSALLATILAIAAAMQGAGWRPAALSLIGVAIGFVLFKSSFGFAGSFRAVLERGDASGFRAQAVALAICTLVFFPLLAVGQIFGMPLSGFGAKVGLSFVMGGILFGIGMQIGVAHLALCLCLAAVMYALW